MLSAVQALRHLPLLQGQRSTDPVTNQQLINAAYVPVFAEKL